MQHITHFLTCARLTRKITQTELARQLGVSRQIVHRWEGGAYDRACWQNLVKVMQLLQVDVRMWLKEGE